MNAEQLFGICLAGCLMVLVLKQYQKVYGMLLGIGICALLLMQMLPQAEQILSAAERLAGQENAFCFPILCKTAGIAWLTQFSTDICRDAGEQALASAAEFCGRILLLMLALPLFVSLSEIILEMMP